MNEAIANETISNLYGLRKISRRLYEACVFVGVTTVPALAAALRDGTMRAYSTIPNFGQMTFKEGLRIANVQIG